MPSCILFLLLQYYVYMCLVKLLSDLDLYFSVLMTNMSNNARSTDVRVRRNTRKNIRKHRLALYQYLDNINDTFFKEQIKLNSSDLGKLSLSSTDHQQNHELEDCKEVVNLNTSKQNPRLGEVKEESIELCSENSDEFLSVESNEEWYGSYSTSDDIDGDSKSELDKQNISRWNDDNKNACKYTSSNRFSFCLL